MNLSGQQWKQLQEALLDAFPNKSSLEQMLLFGLDKNLDAIAEGGSLETIVFSLIKTAVAQGWLLKLIYVARKSNPGNPCLKAIAEEFLHNWDASNFDDDIADTGGIQTSSILYDCSSNPTLVEAVDKDCQFLKQQEERKYDNVIESIYQSENHIKFNNLQLEHKYPNLVIINIQAFDVNLEKKIPQFYLILDISFGEVEEKFKYKESMGFTEREGYIRFGIKFGELCFKLINGSIPLNLRKIPTIEQVFGLVSTIGTDEYPTWQFKVDDKKKSTLFGSLINQELGILSLQNDYCLVEATFQVNVNSNNLGVTEQEGVWNDETSKKVKESKLRAFFKKVVEPKLKGYVSKVVLQYGSTTNV